MSSQLLRAPAAMEGPARKFQRKLTRSLHVVDLDALGTHPCPMVTLDDRVLDLIVEFVPQRPLGDFTDLLYIAHSLPGRGADFIGVSCHLRALSLTECPACDARAQQVEALQCPICMQLSTDKIFQCTSGHLICARCLPRLAAPPRCPTCREPLPRTRIRSLAAEQQGPSPNRPSPGLRHL